eukprot:22150-Chlamydomonas_euryale.AAC.1
MLIACHAGRGADIVRQLGQIFTITDPGTTGALSCLRELRVWSSRGFGSSPDAHRLRATS